jgi:predicted nucleic acid-binding protein
MERKGTRTLTLELNITVYDAAFLALAHKLDLRLLTLDAKFAKKLEGTKYDGIIECPNRKSAHA